MPMINPVKGTHDVIADDADAFSYIESLFSKVCELFGYRKIITPVIEHTEVFSRQEEDASDMVRKEMYTFLDKGNRSLTLRPEGTAGVMRSIVTNKLYASPDLPLKFFYSGPNYRYERPQLGRYREFRQMGVECVGVDSPIADAECITLAVRFLAALGFDKLTLKVNTLGDKASRENYKKALREYFAPRIDSMCEDCKTRLRLNPLRILDCKVPEDQELVKDAPKIQDYLTEESKRRYEQTLALLDQMGITYEKEDTLVRGLDYYGEIVFEVHGITPEGKDYGALGGGGHYDGILTTFGGPENVDVGVGFAFGLERLCAVAREFGLLENIGYGLDCFLMPVSEKGLDIALMLADALRSIGYRCETPFAIGKFGPMFKKAERKKARVAIIIGDDEVAKEVVQVKILATQTQQEVKFTELVSFLKKTLNEETPEGPKYVS